MPGEYTINISGQEKVPGAFNTLVNQLKPRVEIFAPGSEINIYSFARLNFRIEIVGVPSRFDFLDNLARSIVSYLNKNLKNWAYDIKVKFIESG